MRKFNLSFILLSIMILISCSKLIKPIDDSLEEDRVRLNVSIPIQNTKAGTDASIESVQIYVFRSVGGELDAYAKSNTSTVEMSCTIGNKEIVALVNAPDIPGAANKTALLNMVSDLKHNKPTALVMVGETTKDITGSTAVSITVTRLAAKISLSKISKDFASPYYQKEDMKILEVFLVNSVGSVKYSGTEILTEWYNKTAFVSNAAVNQLLYKDVNPDVVISTTPHTGEYTFYTYPNSTSKETSDNKFTRLVVKLSILGEEYYYPISFEGGIESNKTYDITNLTITRPGSDSPDKPITSYDANFTITVKDWEVGSSIDETI